MLHPGGQLGARLKFVNDLMHKVTALPLTGADTVMSEAIVVMTEKALGCLGVVRATVSYKGSSPTATCAVTWETICSTAARPRS